MHVVMDQRRRRREDPNRNVRRESPVQSLVGAGFSSLQVQPGVPLVPGQPLLPGRSQSVARIRGLRTGSAWARPPPEHLNVFSLKKPRAEA